MTTARPEWALPAPKDTQPYDEFAFLVENASDLGVDWRAAPAPRRLEVSLASGQVVSLIQWGGDPVEIVFLHGGGQNAHTWDSVLLALGRNALAIDLPGHGRSDRRRDGNYGPWQNAEAVAEVMERLAPSGRAVCGMSLGGATTTRLAATRPDLVRRAMIIDVTPQVNDPAPDRVMTAEQRGSVALIGGPPTFDSYEQMVELTLQMSPTRTEAGIRRGVRHNSYRGVDGRWAWRYDLQGRPPDDDDSHREGGSDIEARGSWVDFTPLWKDVSKITIPTTLVLGGDSVYVRPRDVEEFRKRLPSVCVETVPGAGHAIQSDQPAALAKLLEDFVFTPDPKATT